MADKLVDDLKRALGDAYTIERELTGGGMSRVFVAKEHALGREVVIKVLPPDLAAGVNRNRFRQEVQLAARLSHPYIVPLLHAGEHDELLWFTMPYIAGESLRTRLQRNGALKLPEVLKLLHDVVEALAYAHSRGVIHRDIKPGNILSDGRHALVTDFGVAKALNAAMPMGGPGHTTSGMAIGTPAYMAPEQLAADPEADHRVDIYAVGLLAYELLSGVSPFAAPSPTATMTAQLTRVPEPLHQLHAEIPPALSDLVQHCLAKSPEDRPPDAQSILHELDAISGALAADVHRSNSGETNGRKRASSVPLVFATAGVLALVACGFLWSQRAVVKQPRADSAAVRLSGDSDANAPLPVKPMTHQDSLRLLDDLREQLGQADPKYAKKPTPKPAATETVPLDIQVERTDSLLRARMRVLYPERSITVTSGTASGAGVSSITVAPATPIVPGTPTAPPVASSRQGNGPASKRLMIVSVSRGRSDSMVKLLQRRAAVELVDRVNRGGGQWAAVTVDTGGMGPGSFGAPGFTTDVIAFISFRRDSADSVRLSIQVRPTDQAASAGFRALTSDAVYHPTNTGPFTATLNDAARLLRQLRQLQPGQVWVQQDFGRGRGGPFDPGMGNFRTVNSRQIDSMVKMGDSLRKLMPKPPPRRRDSIP